MRWFKMHYRARLQLACDYYDLWDVNWNEISTTHDDDYKLKNFNFWWFSINCNNDDDDEVGTKNQ